MELSEVKQHFQKEHVDFGEVAKEIERRKLFGSFSDRRPDLGKMITCPFCRRRRRQFEDPCCTPSYATTVNGKDCSPRVVEGLSKKFMKRFTHKRHGQSRKFQIRHLIKLFQESQNIEIVIPAKTAEEKPTTVKTTVAAQVAALTMHVPVPRLESIPSFAEKYYLWKQERLAKFERKQARRMRKINR